MTTLECDPTEQQSYRIETLHPYTEAMPTPRNFKQWRISSNSSLQSVSEKDQILPEHRSIRVQTSKHLFWANKLIQASEHSLQQAVSRQCKERDTEKTPSHPKQESNPNHPLGPEKQFQISRTQSALAVSTCQPTPSPCLSTSSLPPTIGLADLINFASSLAIASSSDIQLPNLEKMIKASPQKSVAPSTEPVKPSAEPAQPTEDNPKLPENPPKAMEPEKAPEQENNSFPSYLDFNKPGVKRTTIEGEVKFLQTQATSPELQKAKEQPPQKPRRLLTRDPGEERSNRMQKGRSQLHTAQMTQMEPPEAIAIKTEPTTQRTREFKSPVTTHSVWSGPEAKTQSVTDENLLPLTPRQLTAFQDIFKLFSCSPTGTVDMRSMKIALRNVDIQLGPQEMCEALRLADLDGDGIVSFKDFLGVLTDNHYLVQCLRQVRNHRVCDHRSLKTLFIEMLFKLLNQGFVPSKSAQEVMSYYFKKQRTLQLNPGCKGRARGQGRPSRAHAGLNFLCQAARVSGLSNTELARSLHTLYKAGARCPYSQMPKLAGRTRPECKTRSRIPGPDVRLPKPHQPGRSKLPPNLGPVSPDPLRPPAGYVDESLEQMRLSKRAPSPATLVQKQPFSPSPASLQKTVRSLYK
ncbi:Spermatogenesis-associated protein 32 [Sciurus carolinensis]|uniref:Spermatogenesis-associated protein 32 n=1 Tax=Sciurus carolinensis TaxID=30640 RepID=A0AA41NBP1_SCICA|nr:Spermatogenesis-associated protein 32 [Sciurus carolinensis]